MLVDPFHWNWIILAIFKLLKTFGIIPGAVAAYSIKKFCQKQRQKRAVEGWPSTEATIQSGEVHTEGPRRHWAEITYSYFVGEYRSGTYVRYFRREEQADEFVRQFKDKRLPVHHKESNPDPSVLLDREIEMVVSLVPQYS